MEKMNKAIETLKAMAQKNKAANDMFHDFALRERARGQVVVRSFNNRMKAQGFTHAPQEYGDVLKAMAECGFGDIKYNRVGNVIGLFGIKTTLSSIGQAIVGKRGVLTNYAPRNRYSPLKADPTPEIKLEERKPTPREEKREILLTLSGVPNLAKAILEDTSVPSDNRVNAVLALLHK